MISTDPAELLQEIKDAEELRKRFLVNTTALVKKYIGNWYRSDSRGRNRPENMIFTFIATLLPNLIFDNPAVTITAKRSISHKQIAAAMAAAMNGWIKESDLRGELEMLAMDLLFGFGCCKVGLEERGDYSAANRRGVMGRFTMSALTPYMVRIPPANVLIDPQCDNYHSARFLGHMFQRDLDDLRGDVRYDQEVVKSLTPDDGPRVGMSGGERLVSDAKNKSLRNRVTLYELYIPETRQVGTLALNTEGSGRWIRPLADYHGPDKGPYVFFGCYMVPDQVYPLSPVAAMAEQDLELNAHAIAAAREASTAKSILLVSADQPELAAEIQKSGNGDVVKVKGLNANMALPVALGGTTAQRLEYLNLLLNRTDRISGQSDAARGRSSGVTATEAQLADANGDARTEFIHLKYRDAVKDALARVGWYHYHDPAVVSPVSMEDPATGQMSEGLFLGGIQPGQEQTDWSLFFLDIEPMSMRRIDPALQQQQAQFTMMLVSQIAPMIPQFPYMNWTAILDMIGQANNLPDFAKLVLNQQGLMLIQQAGMGGMGMEGMMMGGGSPMAGLGMPPGALPGSAGGGAGLIASGPRNGAGMIGGA